MPGFFEMFQPPTEEERRQYEENQKRMQIAHEDFRHSVQRLCEELDEDQLSTLKTMLGITVHDDGHTASQWEGMVGMSLKMRFNVCVTCNVNHDKEFDGDESVETEIKSSSDVSNDTPKIPWDYTPPPYERQPYDRTEDSIPELDTLSEKERELCYLYHLDDVRDADSHELLYFACTGINGMKNGCGVTYPTIEDRMKRKPEECSGCFSRMAQG